MKLLKHPIRSIREPFGTAGLIVACVALVAALGGTALAAAKLNGTQKKEVEKIAKKYAGKPGTNGANGATGPTGAAGTAGANGKDGGEGKAGTNGKSVTVTSIAAGGAKCEGRAGAEVKQEGAGSGTAVCEGSPWTAGGTLPSGKSETGTWNVAQNSTVPSLFPVAISFPIPLKGAATPVFVNKEETELETEPQGCKWEQGNPAAKPEAPAGKLCVFEQISEIVESPGFIFFQTPGSPLSGTTGPTGIYAYFEVGGSAEAPGTLAISGVWAVTAP